ncbi:MAG: hypothetical protein CM15mV13_1330 [uncultured marine virus]|nr:MAG: hypothetical protein CM15mV13_1330 [uncultured marine virus]
MKAFAVALLGLGFIPSAIADPYVSTKTEFKGNEDGYSKMVNQARIGTTFKVGSLKPYIELVVVLYLQMVKDEGFQVVELGTKFKLTDSLAAKAKFEHKWEPDSERDWKFEVGTKYKF